MLCDNCHEREASVFVTKIVDNETTKQRLCEQCARQKAMGEGWLQQLIGEDAAQLDGMPLEEIVMNLFGQPPNPPDEEHDDYSLSELAALHTQMSGESFGEDNIAAVNLDGEFPADEDLADELDEFDDGPPDEALDGEALDEDPSDQDDIESMEAELAALQAELERSNDFPSSELDVSEPSDANRSETGIGNAPFNPFSSAPLAGGRGSEIPAVRCPKCETTWDRLRQDGRVGCSNCYEVFHNQLNEVMDRLQPSSQHIGKAPRAAAKRRRRLEHLRARRDHRLEMLNARLTKALAAEDYEEAAKLRDKIKIVASTIVSNEM